VRGFLNDGSTDYKSHHSVDSLAFGHCEYSYRNLGRPSRITLRHTSESFKVTVDGRPCFESSKVKLPLGNFFGLSAASAENPDSFEVFKFVTTTDQHSADSAAQKPIHDTGYAAADSQPRGKPAQQATNAQKGGGNIPSYSEGDDVPASKFHSSAEQFADLHNRLQSMMKHIGHISQQLIEERNEALKRQDLLLSKLQSIEASIKIQEGTPNIMKDVQSDVRATKADLHEALNMHAAGIKGVVQNTHHNVIGEMAKSGVGLGSFVLVVVAGQVVVVGAYVLYKRRKANGPKKYL
jgi:mannose-binding lectin 1